MSIARRIMASEPAILQRQKDRSEAGKPCSAGRRQQAAGFSHTVFHLDFMMDRQNYIRPPVTADIDLQFPGHDYITASARDIGDKGMFVVTAGVRLPPHAMVKVRVWTNARHSCFHVMCIIMRRTCHGVGVMFLRGKEKTEEQLRAWRSGLRQATRNAATA